MNIFRKLPFLLKSLSSSRTLYLKIGLDGHDISHPLRSFCIYECKIHDVAFVLYVSFVHLPLHRYPIFRRKNRLKILFKCLSPGRRRYVSFVMKIHLRVSYSNVRMFFKLKEGEEINLTEV